MPLWPLPLAYPVISGVRCALARPGTQAIRSGNPHCPTQEPRHDHKWTTSPGSSSSSTSASRDATPAPERGHQRVHVLPSGGSGSRDQYDSNAPLVHVCAPGVSPRPPYGDLRALCHAPRGFSIIMDVLMPSVMPVRTTHSAIPARVRAASASRPIAP